MDKVLAIGKTLVQREENLNEESQLTPKHEANELDSSRPPHGQFEVLIDPEVQSSVEQTKRRRIRKYMRRGATAKQNDARQVLQPRLSKEYSEPEKEGPEHLEDIDIDFVDVDSKSDSGKEDKEDFLDLPRYGEVHWNMQTVPAVSTSQITSCCCFIVCWMLSIIFIGAILLSADNFEGKPLALAGTIVLCVGILSCLVCCFTVTCGVCAESCMRSPKIVNRHKDMKQADMQWTLIRINDRYKTKQLSRVNNWKPIPYPGFKLGDEAPTIAPSKKVIVEEALKGTSLRELYSRVSPCVFLISFNGSDFDEFRSQVSFCLAMAAPNDKVCVLLTSPGGGVAIYGYASSQLVRIKNANLHLTVCVDLMAASGGYMMACIGDEICAAPFSYVGSIGVVAQVTNYEDLLNKHGVETTVFTAGEYKRTVNTVGKMTEEGKAKFQSNLETIHKAFKKHVATYRGDKIKDIDAIATGEDWLASEALDLGLVDRLCTSDEWIEEHFAKYNVLEFQRVKKKSWMSGVGGPNTLSWLQKPLHEMIDDLRRRLLRLPRDDDQYQFVPQNDQDLVDLA